MKSKKSKTANLEDKRPTLLLLGLILSFAFVLQSFEWLEGDIIIKPVSSLEDENLYEPINEVTIIKPTPKTYSKPMVTKRASKGPVIVDEKIIKKTVKPIEPQTKPSKNLFDPSAMLNQLPTEPLGPDPSVISLETVDFIAVEQKPEFEGGAKAMMQFIAKNIVYPERAKEMGKDGKVYISFIIDEKGNVTNVEIVKGVHKLLDKEAKRVIRKMPKWKPGKQRGKPVKVKYTIPVKYKLMN